MRRRAFMGLLGGVAAWPLAAHAQADRVRRIGLMGNQPLESIERFRKKLAQVGYVEGRNLVIEYRYARGNDQLYPSFTAELIAMPVELIVTIGTPAAFAAKRATSTIPIVLGTVGDVIHTGFVALNADLEEKRLELLREVLPGLARVAVLGNRTNPLNKVNLDTVRRTADNISALFERSADYVRRILDGESPGNLPVQQATSFEIIINMKAAAKLGLTLPPAVLTRADQVIE